MDLAEYAELSAVRETCDMVPPADSAHSTVRCARLRRAHPTGFEFLRLPNNIRYLFLIEETTRAQLPARRYKRIDLFLHCRHLPPPLVSGLVSPVGWAPLAVPTVDLAEYTETSAVRRTCGMVPTADSAENPGSLALWDDSAWCAQLRRAHPTGFEFPWIPKKILY